MDRRTERHGPIPVQDDEWEENAKPGGESLPMTQQYSTPQPLLSPVPATTTTSPTSPSPDGSQARQRHNSISGQVEDSKSARRRRSEAFSDEEVRKWLEHDDIGSVSPSVTRRISAAKAVRFRDSQLEDESEEDEHAKAAAEEDSWTDVPETDGFFADDRGMYIVDHATGKRRYWDGYRWERIADNIEPAALSLDQFSAEPQPEAELWEIGELRDWLTSFGSLRNGAHSLYTFARQMFIITVRLATGFLQFAAIAISFLILVALVIACIGPLLGLFTYALVVLKTAAIARTWSVKSGRQLRNDKTMGYLKRCTLNVSLRAANAIDRMANIRGVRETLVVMAGMVDLIVGSPVDQNATIPVDVQNRHLTTGHSGDERKVTVQVCEVADDVEPMPRVSQVSIQFLSPICKYQCRHRTF